ncbi:MAG: hypothetical protein M1831_007206 [Alyxoria varia]|nr:MAG: hypothetical protein M1831_007206 [Alyxoria varia]
MPSKFLKGLNHRRRSSGNILDERHDQNTPSPPAAAQTSFRVLPRRDTDRPEPAAQPDRVENRILMRPPFRRPASSPAQKGRPESGGDGSGSSNRGSGNTNSTGVAYSSKRDSYASTNPSSVDNESRDDLPLNERPNYHPISRGHTEPYEPPGQNNKSRTSTFSKAAGRAFSFGTRTSKSPSIQESAYEPPTSRPRTYTESTYASTATPPKLDLGRGDLAAGGTDFGDLFSKRKSTIMEEPVSAPGVSNLGYDSSSYPTYPPQARTKTSPDPPAHTLADFEPIRKPDSPYSWEERGSQDGLMSSPKGSSRAFSPPTQASEFEPAGGFQDIPGGGNVFLDAVFASKALENLENELAPPADRKSGAVNKDPAQKRASNDALRTPRKPAIESNLNAPPSVWSGSRTPDRFIGTRDTDVSALPSSSKPDGAGPDDEPLFDAPRSKGLFRSGARNSKHIPKQTNKVMTPAEFERYKNEKADGPHDDDNESAKSSDSEPYEDDDEVERTKQAAKYRRKQEAHLTVYRQQMMKVTGEQPGLPSLPHKGGERFTMSTSNLPAFSFDKNETPTNGKSSTDGEDDDVPLGVLQAHGFPHKSRPPTRDASGGSSTSLHRPETIAAYPPPGGTTRNDPANGGGGSLPAFARNLPSDPYYGASLVRGSQREQLNFSNNGQMQQPPPSNMPPGGLVGVIAGEERAKALRRGSPNTRGTYESSNASAIPHMMQPQQNPMNAMGMAGGNMMGNMPMMQPQQMNSMAQMNQSQADLQQTVTQIAQLQAQFMSLYMNGQAPQQPGMPPNQQMMPPNFPGPMGQMPQMPPMQPGQPPQMTPQIPPVNQQNGFLSPGNNMFRPNSMASGTSSVSQNRESAGSRSPMGQRTSTGLTMPESSAQSMYNMQPPAGYTPSIAPSERSNVGQPSRYRPLTFTNANNENSRTSSMSQQTVQQTSQGPQARRDRAKSAVQRPPSANTLRNSTNTPPVPSTIRAVNRPKHGGADDDDDEQAFAELARKRQERQSKYKSRNPATQSDGAVLGAQDGGMEGLFYEGPIH